ncbi:MAG: multidrug effflux MFS transporter [Rhodoblastus sp.]|nr:multidrug effflux MFS transporter [Rhodoblastus sp.]
MSPARKPRWTDLDEHRASVVSAIMIAIGPLSLSLYTPALPTLVTAFGTTPAAVKFSLTVYFLGFCLAQLLCGPLSDAFGRRPVALAFFLIYFLGSIVDLLAPTIEILQVGRALQGVGAAAGIATSRALVRDLFVGQTSARIMNRIGLFVGLVPAVSPAIGGTLLTVAHWRSIFLLMFAYAIVVVVMVWIFLPETNSAQDRAHAHPFRIVGNYGTLIRDRRFMGPATLMAFVLGGVYTLPSLMPFVLIDKLGLSPLQYAAIVLVQTGALLVGNLFVGRLLRRVNARELVPVGIVIIVVAGAGFAAVRLFSAPYIAAFAIPSAIWSFGLPFVTPGTMTSALSHFPRIAGAASSLIGFMQMGGGFVGSAIGAAAFGDPIVAVDTLLPTISLLAGISYFLLGAPAPSEKTE